jgi:hypothetical protein
LLLRQTGFRDPWSTTWLTTVWPSSVQSRHKQTINRQIVKRIQVIMWQTALDAWHANITLTWRVKLFLAYQQPRWLRFSFLLFHAISTST